MHLQGNSKEMFCPKAQSTQKYHWLVILIADNPINVNHHSENKYELLTLKNVFYLFMMFHFPNILQVIHKYIVDAKNKIIYFMNQIYKVNCRSPFFISLSPKISILFPKITAIINFNILPFSHEFIFMCTLFIFTCTNRFFKNINEVTEYNLLKLLFLLNMSSIISIFQSN